MRMMFPPPLLSLRTNERTKGTKPNQPLTLSPLDFPPFIDTSLLSCMEKRQDTLSSLLKP